MSFDDVDYFTEPSLVYDPNPYFEFLRSKGPVTRLRDRNVVAVTGYAEGLAVFSDARSSRPHADKISRHKFLVMGMITPKRLQENEVGTCFSGKSG